MAIGPVPPPVGLQKNLIWIVSGTDTFVAQITIIAVCTTVGITGVTAYVFTTPISRFAGTRSTTGLVLASAATIFTACYTVANARAATDLARAGAATIITASGAGATRARFILNLQELAPLEIGGIGVEEKTNRSKALVFWLFHWSNSVETQC